MEGGKRAGGRREGKGGREEGVEGREVREGRGDGVRVQKGG